MKYIIFLLIVISTVIASALFNVYAIISAGIFTALYIYFITYERIVISHDDTAKTIKELEDRLNKQSAILSNLEYKMGLRKP